PSSQGPEDRQGGEGVPRVAHVLLDEPAHVGDVGGSVAYGPGDLLRSGLDRLDGRARVERGEVGVAVAHGVELDGHAQVAERLLEVLDREPFGVGVEAPRQPTDAPGADLELAELLELDPGRGAGE